MADARKATVLLTFDFDATAVWIASFGMLSPAALSRGEFGVRVGAPRILNLLHDFNIRATWFLPGHTVESYPRTCEKILEADHEIQLHGYLHEPIENLRREEEERILERGIRCLESLTGQTPRGYRSPSWDMSLNTVDLLLERDFLFDSSLMADDFMMYRIRRGDRVHMDRAYEFGEETKLIEVPVSWHLDDFPPFTFIWRPLLPGYVSTEVVFQTWLDHWEYALEHVTEATLTITMHPQVAGRAHVLKMLEKAIKELLNRNVHFDSMTRAVQRAKDLDLIGSAFPEEEA